MNNKTNPAGRADAPSVGTAFVSVLSMIDVCVKIMVVHVMVTRYMTRKR